MRDARVVGQHDVAVRAVAEQAHDRCVPALDDLHHPAFRAAIGAPPLDSREDVIAVHGVAQVVAADEQVAVDARDRMIRYKEAVAVTVSDDAAGNQVRIARTLGRGAAGAGLRAGAAPVCWRTPGAAATRA